MPQVEAFLGAGGVDPGHQGDAALGLLGDGVEHLLALAVAQGVVLAGGAADDQAMYALADQAVDDLGQRLEVNSASGVEGRYHGSPNTIEVHTVT
ncbi:hypothetical protein D3C80_1653350 [compost metagenome]